MAERDISARLRDRQGGERVLLLGGASTPQRRDVSEHPSVVATRAVVARS